VKQAGKDVLEWYQSLKTTGAFGPVPQDFLEDGRRSFESERVSDPQTLETMQSYYASVGYVLDPHSAVGVAAADRSIGRVGKQAYHISLSTAHPAKFTAAVELALKNEKGFNFKEKVLPAEFADLLQKEERVTLVKNSWQQVRDLVKQEVEEELRATHS